MGLVGLEGLAGLALVWERLSSQTALKPWQARSPRTQPMPAELGKGVGNCFWLVSTRSIRPYSTASAAVR